MFASIVKVVSILALVAQAAVALDPLVLTPIHPAGILQCGQITFLWTGGTTPFGLTLMENKAGPTIKVFPIVLNRAYDWKVNLPSGSHFVVQLQSGPDANGTVRVVTSHRYTILDSSDSSCVNTAVYEYPAVASSRPVPPQPSLSAIPQSSSLTDHTITIVLGVLGGLVALLLVVLALLFRARRKAQVDPEMNKVPVAKVITDDDDDDDLDIKKPLPTHTKK